MKDKYTFDDIPMIMNSISWQLKRIADALEKEDQITNEKSPSYTKPIIRSLLDELDSLKD
jgi:hypothetical protein